MKSIGVLLLIVGVLALTYGGIGFHRDRTGLEMGSMNIIATERTNVPIPFGAVAALQLISGTALLVAARRRV